MAEISYRTLLRQLSADGRSLLGPGLKPKSYRANSLLLRKGERIAGAYVVLDGRLRVFSLAPNGSQSTLYFVDPGETCVLALNCLFNDLLYPAWVETVQDSNVAVIPNAIYRRLFEQERAIRDVTIRALSTATFRLIDMLEQIHGLSLEQRLANLILSHAASDGTLRMTQQQMAQHLGTSREVVARGMSKFARQGWVRTQRGQTTIESAADLVEYVSGSPARKKPGPDTRGVSLAH